MNSLCSFRRPSRAHLSRRALLKGLAALGIAGALPFAGPSPARAQARRLPVRFGDLGPRLIEAGAIDAPRFVALYERAGQPLTLEQRTVLYSGSEDFVAFRPQSSYFLLNFFWAVGLANANPLLTFGPMGRGGLRAMLRFASTGGWTLSREPVELLFSAHPLIELNPAQQEKLTAVATEVYRPCCGNSTSFPDCNHGMAMLGLLELGAKSDLGVDALFELAYVANAAWYPGQMARVDEYLRSATGAPAARSPREAVSEAHFSSRGFRRVTQALASKGRRPSGSAGGSGCSV